MLVLIIAKPARRLAFSQKRLAFNQTFKDILLETDFMEEIKTILEVIKKFPKLCSTIPLIRYDKI